jgi:hypothetical protein
MSEPADEPVEPLAGLVGRDVDQADDDDSEWAVETSEDIVLRSSGGSEFQVPDASQELFASRQMPEPSPFGGESRPVQETRPEPAEEPPPRFVELSALAEPTREAAAQPVADAKPEPETKPEPEIPAPAPVAQAEPEPAPPPRPRFAAADTNGESVASFLGKLLAARLQGVEPVSAPSAPTPPRAEADTAAPTRPAADALSLSSVFGEEPATLPPVVPAPGSPAGAVSFDEFYSPSGPATGARNPRGPDNKNDDLDQFHAWLQNLKR